VKNVPPAAVVVAVNTAVAVVVVVVATKPVWISKRSSVRTGLRFLFFWFVPIAAPPAMKEEHIEVAGSVTKVLPGTMFRVEPGNKEMSPCHPDKTRANPKMKFAARAPGFHLTSF
jgi:hypothetical protein